MGQGRSWELIRGVQGSCCSKTTTVQKLSCHVTGNVEVVLSNVFLLALLLFISYFLKNYSECHFLSFPNVPLGTVADYIKMMTLNLKPKI